MTRIYHENVPEIQATYKLDMGENNVEILETQSPQNFKDLDLID